MPVGITISSTGADQVRDATNTAAGGAAVSASATGGQGTSSTDVSVSGGSSRGDLNSNNGPATIAVTNSTDLNALAEAVTLAALGENITVSGSNFTRGTGQGGINLDLGTINERLLKLANSNFSADVIKARSFNNGLRDALLIEGGTFNAAQLLRLYAEGNSTLRFRGQVTLNSLRTELAGKRVSIDAGGRVLVNGNVLVFTDDADFDKVGRGNLEATGTKQIQPHGGRGRF